LAKTDGLEHQLKTGTIASEICWRAARCGREIGLVWRMSG
jgi:hypothetical protein